MIEPGAMIGEMEFVIAEKWHWDNNLYTLCEESGERVEVAEQVSEISCELPAGSQMIFNCVGVQGESTEDLDREWPKLRSEMIIDGKPINLPPFGSIDFEYDYQFRIWGVLLKNMAPGAHTLYCCADLEGDIWATTYHFTAIEPAVVELPANADELLFQGQSEKFSTLAEFYDLLQTAVANGQVYAIWNPVKATGQMPLIFGDYAVFLYRSAENNVLWVTADFQEPYVRQGDSNLWMLLLPLKADAYLEYNILDGSAEIVDPLNPLLQDGFYQASIVQMPNYIYPEELLYREDIAHGELTDNILISSDNLGYDKHYRVYTPPGYETMAPLPAIYVTDGTDAISENYLGMVNVLDNLIADGRIQPIIAVFIDPHDAQTGEWIRGAELGSAEMGDCPFCDFVAEELVPEIDANYKTIPTANGRALLGTSLGGLWASYMGLAHHESFSKIGIQSLHLTDKEWILDGYQELDPLPVRVFIHHSFYEVRAEAPQLAEILRERGTPLHFVVTNGGHSYGSWRGTTAEMLIYFFGHG